MEWVILIAVGLLVGVVAKVLMPGRDPGGWIVTILLGIGGSLLASWLAPKLGWHPTGRLMSFAASVLGAMAILLVYRLVFRRG